MYLFLGNIMDIINVPLGWILYAIYWLLGNYGWSILLFAVLAKVLMLPSSIKTHKNQMRMREIQPKIKRIQEKYHNDNRNPKLQQELQDLYTREGYSPMAGCLPTLLQFPLIFGLWNVVRQPLTYICDIPNSLYATTEKLVNAGDRTATSIHTLIDKIGGLAHSDSAAHHTEVQHWVLPEQSQIQSALEMNEIYIADAVNQNQGIEGLAETLGGRTMIETEFLGINLGETASAHGLLSWFIIIPILAAVSSFLVSYISMKVNKSALGENPGGKGMNAMMYLMPLLSLWIGYTMNIGVALYWVATNLLSLLQAIYLPRFLEKKKEEEPVKEKKLNYTQIEKMKRDEEKNLLNGEKVDDEKAE